MATRRPASRVRTNNGSTLAPSSSSNALARPRSALAKPTGSHLTASTEDQSDPTFSLSASGTNTLLDTAPKKTFGYQGQEGGESHIQVVIRCRRRSEREIQESSPIIVSSDGPRGQNVTIETAAPSSTLGVITLPPTRTYPFDTVFGPEADQSMVYQDVVHPMLEEVLKGYNCTLFAYGQTGTGKTYTMQGDVSLTPLGNPSPQAGMIPRVLFKLFYQLEACGCDYSVKISYVELYNEELRDLLAPELSAPNGTTQPMGMGGNKDAQSNLRIFDDSNKKGVFIQGLEETPVKDFNDALALLAKGSQRRQIAATKFNDHSSRSHSVFSITVHSKEISSLGDDLLKVGKLNLVDLAGSENIGRSGAENKRAREAGMINQSLLTLGRVINALVDKSSHVPYRESKLTRLLQDSLGGRTKTCIIATISPARSNMEETLSTLDYAMRAKSIRNKPEVNQRMTRNALLKEYVTEIERLKSDVLAAREKNGIYFSEETWAQLNAEHEMRQTQVEETKKQIEIIESQMRSVREEFEQSIALLVRTDGELKETKEKLVVTEGALENREEELKEAVIALEEEVIIRKAHAASEETIDNVAIGLKKVVEESTSDVVGLFTKIERKALEFDSCSRAIKGQSKFLDAESRSLLSSLEDFVKASELSMTKTRTLAESFQKTESAALSARCQEVEGQVKRIQDGLRSISSKEDASEKNLSNIWTIVNEVQDRLANELSSWSMMMQKNIDEMCSKIEETSTMNFTGAEQALGALSSLVEKLVKDSRSQLETERKTSEQHCRLVTQLAAQEIARLEEQNTRLSVLLEEERSSSLKAKDVLVKRVSSLLVDFTEERDRNMRNIVDVVRSENAQASQDIGSSHKEYDVSFKETNKKRCAWDASLNKAVDIGNNTKQAASKNLSAAYSAVEGGLSKLRSSTNASFETHTEGMMQVSQVLNTCSAVFENERKIKRARIDAATQLGEVSQRSMKDTREILASTSQSIGAFTRQLDAESSQLRMQTKSYTSTSTAHISSLQKHTQLLMEQGTRQDPPTGTTPRKRRWQYVEKWERTQSRSELLREFRRGLGLPLVDEACHVAPTSLSVSSGQTSQQEEPEPIPEVVDVKMETDWGTDSQPLLETCTDMVEKPGSALPIVAHAVSAQSFTSMKIQPVRPLSEKSTNIIDTRTRVTRRRR